MLLLHRFASFLKLYIYWQIYLDQSYSTMKCEADQSSSTEQETAKRCLHYFLFVNSKSGNKQGLKYLQLSQKKLNYVFGNSCNATTQIFDMFDHQRIKLCFKVIKELTESEPFLMDSVRLIICGGDGTISWVLGSARQAGIDFERIVIGILPIGTGNDFSRSVGWGYKPTLFSSLDFTSLHRLVKKWNKAEIGCYDIWDIEIEVFEGGAFYEIKNQNQIKLGENRLRKSFTNYFGIGLDARVVYNVQKSRGSNAFINKLRYTYVGIKNFFKPMQNIQQIIQTFKQHRLQPKPQTSHMLSSSQLTTTTTSSCEQNEIIHTLKNGYKGLVCLNCTSYMCGLRDVWMTNKASNQELGNRGRQKFDDGKLEFICFNNQLSLALERIMRTGVRVAQGSGPFEIQFKEKSYNLFTYMEIDGQSVKIENLKCIKVKRSEKFSKGSIKVLINNEL